MKPFRTNPNLVINQHFCSLNDSFAGVDSSYNDIMLSVMSEYICLYNFNTIRFEYLYMTFFPNLCVIKIIARRNKNAEKLHHTILNHLLHGKLRESVQFV